MSDEKKLRAGTASGRKNGTKTHTDTSGKDGESLSASVMDELTSALSMCDADTIQHCLRVGVGAKTVMEEYQRKYKVNLDFGPMILQWAATLHDVGKSKVPLRIIMKPTALTPEERTIIMKHPAYGRQIVDEIFDEKNRIMRKCAYEVILYHHERFDGRGYPNRLQGDEIPLSAQMVGLADCFDALISARSYKPAFSTEKAFNMIMNGECGSFSPKILSCLPKLVELTNKKK